MAAGKPRCAGCGRPLNPRANFCPHCGHRVLATAGASLQVDRRANLEEERRIVTVLFADLSGSTSLAERLDPEEMREIIAAYFKASTHEIQRFGGTVDKFIGDAVMAVFGAPVTHEDDPERALHAALAMQGAIANLNDRLERDHGVRLALRIGVNTGDVVSGALAGDSRSAYTVVGDAVNTAQRLESAAPIGQVLAGPKTHRLAVHAFQFEELAPIPLKGKSQPVPAYRVVGVRETAVEDTFGPLIGREGELDALREGLAGAVEGRGRPVALVGEAGVGKSRLVSEFLAGLSEEVPVLVIQCASFQQATPYALVADLLRAILDIRQGETEAGAMDALDRRLAELDRQLDETPRSLLLDLLGYRRVECEPEARRHVLVTAFQRLLGRDRGQPGVLVAEDLHWIDAASAATLGDLVPLLSRSSWLLIATGRDSWIPSWESVKVALEPLSEDLSGTLVSQVLGAAAAPGVVDAIQAKAGGNPLFVAEVARALRASGAIALGNSVWSATGRLELQVPDTVQEVLGARIDGLSRDPRRTLQSASVIGRNFWYRVLQRIVPTRRLAAQLDVLEEEALIELLEVIPERSFTFRHALIQEVAYSRLLLAHRRRLHAGVGEAIEKIFGRRLEEFVDLLAYHYARSDDLAKARGYLIAAGERAQRLYASQEAIAYFQAALERSQDEPASRATALEGLADVYRFTGAYPQALACCQEAMDQPTTGSLERGRLLRKMGILHQLKGESEQALQIFDEAMKVLPEGAGWERALVLTEIGQNRWHQGQYPGAVEILSRAVATAQRAGAKDAEADADKQLGTAHLLNGDTGSAEACYSKSLSLYEALGDRFGQANVLNNIGIVHRRTGRYAEAVDAHEKALEVRQRIGDPHGIGMSRNNLAQIHRARGELERAAEDFGAALELWESIGYAYGIALARTGLGITVSELGDRLRGRSQLLKANAEWKKLGSRSYQSETQRYVAQAWLPDAPSKALTWAEKAVRTARGLSARDQEGVALQVRGQALLELKRIEEAIGSLEESRALLSVTAERQELVRTLALLGIAYSTLPSQDARRDQATGLLEEARQAFQEMGALGDLRRLEEAVGPEALLVDL